MCSQASPDLSLVEINPRIHYPPLRLEAPVDEESVPAMIQFANNQKFGMGLPRGIHTS